MLKFFRLFFQHLSAFKTGVYNLARTPTASAMTLAAIGVCLSLPISLYLFTQNIHQLSHGWDQGTSITLYVDANSTPLEIQAILKNAKQYPAFKKSDYLTATQALHEFETYANVNETLALLPENPLPAVITLHFDTQKISHPELIRIKDTLAIMPRVNIASLDHEWMEKLKAFLDFGKDLSNFLYLIIGLGVILMVSNTIRLSLERHQNEIEVFHLIGATTAFIRRPFLYRGILYGSLGGLIALTILRGEVQLLQSSASELASLYEGIFTLQPLTAQSSVIFLIASAGLGWLGAMLAFLQQQRAIIRES